MKNSDKKIVLPEALGRIHALTHNGAYRIAMYINY